MMLTFCSSFWTWKKYWFYHLPTATLWTGLRQNLATESLVESRGGEPVWPYLVDFCYCLTHHIQRQFQSDGVMTLGNGAPSHGIGLRKCSPQVALLSCAVDFQPVLWVQLNMKTCWSRVHEEICDAMLLHLPASAGVIGRKSAQCCCSS